MSEIDIEKIRSGSMNGTIVYICDYRLGDGGVHNKPIRNIPPTRVIVRSNDETKKRVYYSVSHFAKLGKNDVPTATVIPVYDNTVFCSFTGTPVRVFDNIDECVAAFNDMVDVVIKKFEDYKATIVPTIDSKIEELRKLKG